MKRTGLFGIVLGLSCAMVIACAGGAMKAASPSSRPVAAGGLGMDPHAEIESLEETIAAERQQMGLGELPAPPIAPACESCPQPMATIPKSTDATCQHGASATCTDVCTLSDSICDSAGKICTLADKLAGDLWAAGKCTDGKASCAQANEKCCSCR